MEEAVEEGGEEVQEVEVVVEEMEGMQLHLSSTNVTGYKCASHAA